MKHKAILAPLALLLLFACGGEPPGAPTPLPTVPPQNTLPTPPPPPTPFRLTSPSQLTASLHSAVNCCAPPSGVDIGVAEGWPFFSDRVADLYRRAGVRLTEVRIGPSNGSGGDPGYEESLMRLEERAAVAERQGLGLLVGIDDCWVRRHGFNVWGEDGAPMQRAPRAHHLAWAREVGRLAARHPNVVLFDGNESFVCRASREWSDGLQAAARSAGYTGLFGSNAENGAGDFQVHHGWRPVEHGSILLESDNRDHTVEDWRALRASSGGAVAFWRGPLTWEEWERLLLAPLDASCQPPPECPAARKMGVSFHEAIGSLLVFNITPKFALGSGMQPCNQEKNAPCRSACGAFRLCEPPQEPSFTVQGNYSQARVRSNNRYLLNVSGVVGPITVTTCWNPASTDAQGVSLDLSEAECDEVTVP